MRTFSFAKTLSLFIILIGAIQFSHAQCNNASQYGSAVAPTAGGTNNISGCNYATEYAPITSVVAATQYQITSSIATDYITVRQGTPGGAVIANGVQPLSWTSTVAGTYYIHFNTNAACGTQSSCRSTDITHIIPSVPMTFVSSTSTQPNTTGLEICATDAEIIQVEVVTAGNTAAIDFTALRITTTGTTTLADLTNIDIYYTGTSATYSTAILFGSAAPVAGNIDITGTQTLSEGTNYFWVTYDLATTSTIGNFVDATCSRITVDASNENPTTTSPAGNRTLIACGRTCPTTADIYTDDFESGAAVEGVIPGTTYGTIWTGLPHAGTYHAWLNIVNGLSNVDVFERRFDNYYMGCDVTFDYWYLHNSIGFDAEYILVDDNNNIIDFNNVVTTAVDVNVYQNQVVTFTPTTTGITLRIHVNSTGGAGMDIAFDDFGITQCCPIVLPVELLSFNAECNYNTVKIDWATASEINNDYFNIERSTDALNFESLGIVSGNGNSSTIMNYSWTDNNPVDGTAYYRLKQIDFNGAFEYSEIVAVSCEQAETISIYPNPFKKSFTVQIPESIVYPITVEVNDYLGRIVHHQKVISSTTEITLDEKLPAGSYLVKVVNETKQVVERIVKMK